MERLYKYESITNIIKNVYDNSTVIKEINFDDDIDMIKSGKIMRDEKGIQYLGELKEFESLSESIKVYGEYKVEDKALTFTGEKKHSDYKWHGISRVMLNKTFDEDLFYFSIDRDSITNGASTLFVSLFGEEYYNTLLNASHDSVLYKNLNLEGVRQCHIIAQGNRISISLYKGYEKLELFAFESLRRNVSVLVNRKLGQIIVDGHVIRYGDFFPDNSELYILFGYNMNSQSFDWEAPKIKDISFGRYTGFIYCKPIPLENEELEQKQFKIQAIAKGNPQIEIYNRSNSEWINLDSVNKIDEVSLINIRIRMEFSDRLYSLLVYKDKRIG